MEFGSAVESSPVCETGALYEAVTTDKVSSTGLISLLHPSGCSTTIEYVFTLSLFFSLSLVHTYVHASKYAAAIFFLLFLPQAHTIPSALHTLFNSAFKATGRNYSTLADREKKRE